MINSAVPMLRGCEWEDAVSTFREHCKTLLSRSEQRALKNVLRSYHDHRNIVVFVDELESLLEKRDSTLKTILRDVRHFIPSTHVPRFDQHVRPLLARRQLQAQSLSSMTARPQYPSSLGRHNDNDPQFLNNFPQEPETTRGICLSLKLTRRRGEKLGVCVRGGSEHGLGLYVSDVKENGAADRAGLFIGDQLWEIDGTKVEKVSSSDVVQFMASRREFRLTVIRVGKVPKFRHLQERVCWCETEHNLLIQGDFQDPCTEHVPAGIRSGFVAQSKINLSITNETSDLGFNIRGGSDFGLAIYVSKVDDDGIAKKSGLKAGHKITHVNEGSLAESTHAEAVARLKSDSHIVLTVQATGRYPTYKEIYTEYSWLDMLSEKPKLTYSGKAVRIPLDSPAEHEPGDNARARVIAALDDVYLQPRLKSDKNQHSANKLMVQSLRNPWDQNPRNAVDELDVDKATKKGHSLRQFLFGTKPKGSKRHRKSVKNLSFNGPSQEVADAGEQMLDDELNLPENVSQLTEDEISAIHRHLTTYKEEQDLFILMQRLHILLDNEDKRKLFPTIRSRINRNHLKDFEVLINHEEMATHSVRYQKNPVFFQQCDYNDDDLVDEDFLLCLNSKPADALKVRRKNSHSTIYPARRSSEGNDQELTPRWVSNEQDVDSENSSLNSFCVTASYDLENHEKKMRPEEVLELKNNEFLQESSSMIQILSHLGTDRTETPEQVVQKYVEQIEVCSNERENTLQQNEEVIEKSVTFVDNFSDEVEEYEPITSGSRSRMVTEKMNNGENHTVYWSKSQSNTENLHMTTAYSNQSIVQGDICNEIHETSSRVQDEDSQIDSAFGEMENIYSSFQDESDELPAELASPLYSLNHSVRNISQRFEEDDDSRNDAPASHVISISKLHGPLGLSVSGGRECFQQREIRVKSIEPGGAAHNSKLQEDVEILRVDNFSLQGCTHMESLKIFKRCYEDKSTPHMMLEVRP